MSQTIDCVIVGAGVVGLAIARAIQLSGRQAVLVESADSFGTGISSRNSEVIHAGIYYAPGSLKASLCVRGKHLLYEYCSSKSIPHKRLGKLIVATNHEQERLLQKYFETANANGVVDLAWIDRRELSCLEPSVCGELAILSPSTGIVDSHSLMTSLLGDFEDSGGVFLSRTPYRSAHFDQGEIVVQLADDDGTTIRTKALVNSAGLQAQDVASRVEGLERQHIPDCFFAVGHYYQLAGRTPFKRLVYPVAAKGGLGVHATLDLQDRVRFGPDVRWREKVDYTFDDSERDSFIDAIAAYFPSIRNFSLIPGYTGIRPKLYGPSRPDQDFVIQTEATHRFPGLINLFGIESPGLTASLAIAELLTSSEKFLSA